MFYEKVVLKRFKALEKKLFSTKKSSLEIFLVKLQTSASNVMKKQFYSVNFAKHCRTSVLQKTKKWQFLILHGCLDQGIIMTKKTFNYYVIIKCPKFGPPLPLFQFWQTPPPLERSKLNLTTPTPPPSTPPLQPSLPPFTISVNFVTLQFYSLL